MIPNQPFAPKSKALSSMADSMPVANALAAQQVSEANKTNLQNSIAQAVKTQAPAQQAASQLGTGAAQVQGQTQLAQQQANIEGQAKIGQQFLADANEEANNRLREARLDNTAKNYNEARRLGNLDTSLKNQLFDSNMTFKKDELGRTLFNDRQLLDYKLSSAKSEEDLAKYEQDIEQQYARKMQILAAAQAKIVQAMQQDYTKGEQELDQAHKKELVLKKAAIDEKIRKEKAKAANRAAQYSAAGSIVGAVAGAVIGSSAAGPAGTVAGAQAGSAIGSGLGSVVSSQT